jgi:hypothetical protein
VEFECSSGASRSGLPLYVGAARSDSSSIALTYVTCLCRGGAQCTARNPCPPIRSQCPGDLMSAS